MKTIFIFSVILYGISSTGYLYFLKKDKEIIQRISFYSALSGLFFHLLTFIIRWSKAGFFPVSNLFESIFFFTLITIIIYLSIERIYKLRILGSFIIPLVFLISLSTFTLNSKLTPLNPALQSGWLFVHTMFCFLSYAGFLQTFCLGIMYLTQERQLKRKNPREIYRRLPSLQVLDKVGYYLLRFGFIFLTLGIVSGSIWAKDAWGAFWSWDPKEVWTLITWLIYATVLHARAISGWRGRKAAYLSIAGFISLLFTFFGVTFLLDGLHSYM